MKTSVPRSDRRSVSQLYIGRNRHTYLRTDRHKRCFYLVSFICFSLLKLKQALLGAIGAEQASSHIGRTDGQRILCKGRFATRTTFGCTSEHLCLVKSIRKRYLYNFPNVKGHNGPIYYIPLLKELHLVYLRLCSPPLLEKEEKMANNSHQPFMDFNV